jgi:uncharacterized membrane protein SpoIIM required for sporulation
MSDVYSGKLLHKSFFKRYESEIIIFWGLFIGVVLGMYVCNFFGLTTDFQYEKAFVESVSGNIINFDSGLFEGILVNNLFVAFNTFLISLFFFSGLIFVVIWNASILAYYLYNLNSHSVALVTGLNLLVHALLEIGGYVWAGILGAVLSYRLSIYFLGYGNLDKYSKKKVLDKSFALDCLVMFLLCVGFIFLGAVVEVL